MDTSHPTIQPARLKKYAYSQIDSLNKTSKVIAGICTILGARHELVSTHTFDTAVEITLTVANIKLTLLADHTFVQEIGRAHFDLPSDYIIPQALQCASVENVLSPFLTQLESHLQITITVDDVRLPDPDAQSGTFDYYAIFHPDHPYFMIGISLEADFPEIPLPLYPVNENLNISFPIVLDEMSLTLTEIESLDIGDIFLSHISRNTTTINCRLPIAGQWISATIQDNKLLFKHMDIQMIDQETANAPAPTLNDDTPAFEADQNDSNQTTIPVAEQKIIDEQTLGEVQINVRFDLGEISLPLKDIQNLVEGSVVELPQSFDELVRISINSTPIGQAELIDIDGKVGVRILRLNR
ncbi:MAG: FliM/FliN family flagellar motor switch protein [Methylocystaceae bacterium]|nr:FliM/FliN family flagellar motor switch protein [Methylocystaceae bacterium]